MWWTMVLQRIVLTSLVGVCTTNADLLFHTSMMYFVLQVLLAFYGSNGFGSRGLLWTLIGLLCTTVLPSNVIGVYRTLTFAVGSTYWLVEGVQIVRLIRMFGRWLSKHIVEVDEEETNTSILAKVLVIVVALVCYADTIRVLLSLYEAFALWAVVWVLGSSIALTVVSLVASGVISDAALVCMMIARCVYTGVLGQTSIVQPHFNKLQHPTMSWRAWFYFLGTSKGPSLFQSVRQVVGGAYNSWIGRSNIIPWYTQLKADDITNIVIMCVTGFLVLSSIRISSKPKSGALYRALHSCFPAVCVLLGTHFIAITLDYYSVASSAQQPLTKWYPKLVKNTESVVMCASYMYAMITDVTDSGEDLYEDADTDTKKWR